MPRPERGHVKDSNPANTEQKLSSQEVERFARSVFGEFPYKGQIPGTENLAEELEAARKRVADYHRDG